MSNNPQFNTSKLRSLQSASRVRHKTPQTKHEVMLCYSSENGVQVQVVQVIECNPKDYTGLPIFIGAYDTDSNFRQLLELKLALS